MPKKAQPEDTVDPVRSRLAGAAAAPVVREEPRETLKAPRRAREQDTAPSEVVEEQPATRRRTAVPRRPDRLEVPKKFLVTPGEAERITDLTQAVGEAFGAKLAWSQVARCLFSVLADAEEGLRAGARRARVADRRVPSKGDPEGMAEFEEELTRFIEAAIKRRA